MTRARRFIVAAVAALLAVAAMLAAPRAQAEPAAATSGSLAVSMLNAEGHEPVPGGTVDLLMVASIAEDGSYRVNAAFESAGVSLDDLNAPGVADHLWAFSQDNAVAGASAAVGEGGTATFGGLARGLYLVGQSAPAEGYYPVEPFLVSLPSTGPDGEQVWNLEASPKVEAVPPVVQPVSIEVTKVWANAALANPSYVTVDLLCNGSVRETVRLSAANNWSHSWTDLDGSFSWSVVESSVPQGYRASYEVLPGKVIVTNSAGNSGVPQDPGADKGQDGNLIQTGQLNWPVPVAIACGLALLVAGRLLAGGKSRKDA